MRVRMCACINCWPPKLLVLCRAGPKALVCLVDILFLHVSGDHAILTWRRGRLRPGARAVAIPPLHLRLRLLLHLRLQLHLRLHLRLLRRQLLRRRLLLHLRLLPPLPNRLLRLRLQLCLLPRSPLLQLKERRVLGPCRAPAPKRHASRCRWCPVRSSSSRGLRSRVRRRWAAAAGAGRLASP